MTRQEELTQAFFPIMSILTDCSFEELDPVTLLNQTGLDRTIFADAMGVERQTVDRWCARIRKPERMAYRLAAELKRRIEREGNL